MVDSGEYDGSDLIPFYLKLFLIRLYRILNSLIKTN